MHKKIAGKIVLVVGFLGISFNANAAIVFDGGFETGDHSQWSDLSWNLNRPESEQFEIVTDIVRDGRYAAKMTVHDGDEFLNTGGERVQLERPDAYNENEGDEYWYSWSTYFPDDWQNLTNIPDDWLVIADWHATNNATFEDICQPLQIELNGSNQLIATMLTGDVTGYDCFNGPGTANYYDQVIVDGIELGKWNDFRIHVKWTVEDDGVVEIWHKTGNEETFDKVFNQVGVPTRQYVNDKSNSDTPYFILAHYRSEEQSHTSVLYQDAFRQATALSDLEALFVVSPSKYSSPVLKLSGKKKKLKKNKRVYIKKRKFKLSGVDSQLAGGQVKLACSGKKKIAEEDTINADGKWKIKVKARRSGGYKCKIKYYNVNGDKEKTFKFKMRIDTEDPEFTKFSSKTYKNSGDVIKWKARDNRRLKKFKVSFNGKIYKTKIKAKKGTEVKGFFTIPDGIAAGAYNMKVKVYDKAGNKSVEKMTVIVR